MGEPTRGLPSDAGRSVTPTQSPMTSLQHTAVRATAVVTILLLAAAGGGSAQVAGGGGPACDLDRPAGSVAAGAGERCAPTITPPAGAAGHELRAPAVRAVALEGEIDLNGRLDEAVWSSAPAATGFVQRDPDEGRPASQRTEVRFVYGEDHLYVGARMYDEAGTEGVSSRLVRRDSDPKSDQLTITFDTFLDHQGQTRFSVNPAGVRGDAYGPAGSNPNSSWDPVWSVETRVDAEGWTAEIAIPFHQLRFDRDGHRWGLQIERELNRRNETAMWSFWHRDQSGGPSRFGHLEGIRAPSGGGKLEVLPYTVAKLDVAGAIDADDPFARKEEPSLRAGADVTYQLSSNLTLNATLNPDFGQVEVDPAVVNLSAVETFFPEKREFFVQGQGVFSFGGIWCQFCTNTSSLNMLHTRRIGRSPQGTSLARGAGEFAEVPDATTIIGAAKLTGQLENGLSVGVLNATTGREHARILGEGGRFSREVEPLSNYFVARARKDYEEGDLQVGGIFTSVVRDLGDPALQDRLAAHAEGIGLDAEYWWGDRTHHLLLRGAVSNVTGSDEAVLRLQRSSARYFQRPDREHGGNGLFTDRLDPTLTSMRGYGLYARLAKDAGDWRWEGFANVRSPGFEANDIGFITRTDYAQLVGNVLRTWSAPSSWFRTLTVVGGGQVGANFDGDLTEKEVHGALIWQGLDFWEAQLIGVLRPSALHDRLTRGGPVVRSPDRGFLAATLTTDTRRSVYFRLSPSTGWNEEGARDWSLRASATLKPVSNLALELGPRFSHTEVTDQFVTAEDDPTAEAFFGRRYLFADLEQETLAMETRLNWTFSPTMSLELFAQPFVSSNEFSRYKEFSAPRRLQKLVYGEDRGTIAEETVVDDDGRERRVVTVDPDGGGPADPFSFADPDFNFRSLRGNLVFRWEYTPGSTLFFVWTQDRQTTAGVGDFDLGRDLDGLFASPADNVFLVKATYWMGL